MKKPNPIAKALRSPHLRQQKVMPKKGKGAPPPKANLEEEE